MNENAYVPPGWDPHVWQVLNEELESMTTEQVYQAMRDLGVPFSDPVGELDKEDMIPVADEIDPQRARDYLKAKK